MMRIIRSRVYDRVKEMREHLDARTRSMTMKERDEKREENNVRRKIGVQY